MKRIFYFKKGEKTDGDEEYLHFLYEKLTPTSDPNGFPIFAKNWKLTIIIEEKKEK